MNQLNQVILEGNIMKMEEAKEQGHSIARLCVATVRSYRRPDGNDSREVSFFECEFHGDFGKKIAGRCAIGQGVRIIGRLRQTLRENPGGDVSEKVTVVAEHVEFLPFKENNEV